MIDWLILTLGWLKTHILMQFGQTVGLNTTIQPQAFGPQWKKLRFIILVQEEEKNSGISWVKK